MCKMLVLWMWPALMQYVLNFVAVCFLCLFIPICAGVQWNAMFYAVSAVFAPFRIVHANVVSAVVDISMLSTADLLSAISVVRCLLPIVCVTAAIAVSSTAN